MKQNQMKQKELPTVKSTGSRNINILLIILISVYFSLFFLYEQNMTNFDYGKLVKYGEVIVENGEVFSTNYFSYTHPDYPFVNHHWGSGLIFYFVHQLFGFGGLTIMGLLLNLGAFLIIVNLSRKTGNMPITVFFIILSIPLIASRNQPRPEAFSIFFFALSIFLLFSWYKGKLNRNWLFALPVIQLLWINIHVLFFFGLFLQGVFLLQLLLNKTKKADLLFFSIILLLGVAFSFINPFFEKAVFYPFSIMGDIQYAVSENTPLFELGARRGYPAYFIQFELLFGISLLLIYFWIKNRKQSFPYLFVLIWLIVFGLLTLYRIRANVFFGYLLILFGNQTYSLTHPRYHKWQNIFAGTASVLLVFLISVVGFKQYNPYHSEIRHFGIGIDKNLDDAAEFFKEHKIKGPIFNNFDVGDYLVYYLFPEEKVFVDSRPEAYPPGFFTKTLVPALFDERKWLDLDLKYNFNVIFLGKHLQVIPFIKRRLLDSNWFVVFYDRYSIIFVKNNAVNNNIIRNDLIRKKNLEILKHKLNEFVID